MRRSPASSTEPSTAFPRNLAAASPSDIVLTSASIWTGSRPWRLQVEPPSTTAASCRPRPPSPRHFAEPSSRSGSSPCTRSSRFADLLQCIQAIFVADLILHICIELTTCNSCSAVLLGVYPGNSYHRQ